MGKGVLVPQHAWHSSNECETLAFEKLLRALLPVEAIQLGFVIKELQLAGRTDHVQVDDSFDLPSEGRC